MGIDLNRFKGKKNQDWVDWLADDPAPASVRNRMRQEAVRNASAPAQRNATVKEATPKKPADRNTGDGTKTVSIHISIPSGGQLKQTVLRAKKRIAKYKPPKYALIGAVTVIVLGALAGGGMLLRNRHTSSEEPGAEVLSTQTAKPDFEYSLPKGDAQEVRYNSERKVVSFVDSIGGVEITVSQQPLPEGFKDSVQDKVRKLAEDFSATEVLSTANPTAFLGTSAKGPQTVIFAKKDLLVFIQSAKKIDNHDWAEYITNLK